MDNNYNGENQNTSGSQYSYSYINREDPNQRYYTSGYEPGQQAYGAVTEPGKKKSGKGKGGFGVTLGKAAAIALVFGLISGTVFYGTGYVFEYAGGKQKQTGAVQEQIGTADSIKPVADTGSNTTVVVSDVTKVVDSAMPSIVSITGMYVQEYQSWFGQTMSQERPGAGSGIIVSQDDEKLYIATNNHVVAGMSSLTVGFVDDAAVPAEVKGVDQSTDLAVVSVNISDIPEETLGKIKVARMGNSDTLKIGEPTVAIGNAMGYGQSVTSGIISALNREVSVQDNEGNVITNDLIQTDAAINPGNSGGALLNVNGEVIGINSVKYADTDVEGMGYAIPISVAEPIINDLITREVVEESKTAYLGVYGVDVTDEISARYNMPKGVYVRETVQGSAAQEAGIKTGDIITSFDGRTVSTMDELSDCLQYYAAGTEVEIVVQTVDNGQYVEHTIKVKLGRKN